MTPTCTQSGSQSSWSWEGRPRGECTVRLHRVFFPQSLQLKMLSGFCSEKKNEKCHFIDVINFIHISNHWRDTVQLSLISHGLSEGASWGFLVCGWFIWCLFQKTHTKSVGRVVSRTRSHKPQEIGFLLKPCSSYTVGKWVLRLCWASSLILTTDISFGYTYLKMEVKKGSEMRV